MLTDWLLCPAPSPPCYAHKPWHCRGQNFSPMKDIKISRWTIRGEQIIFPCQTSITGRSDCSCSSSWDDSELLKLSRVEKTVNTWATNDLLIALNAYYCYVVLPSCRAVHHSVFTVAVYTDIWALYFIPCSCVASHCTPVCLLMPAIY